MQRRVVTHRRLNVRSVQLLNVQDIIRCDFELMRAYLEKNHECRKLKHDPFWASLIDTKRSYVAFDAILLCLIGRKSKCSQSKCLPHLRKKPAKGHASNLKRRRSDGSHRMVATFTMYIPPHLDHCKNLLWLDLNRRALRC